MKLRPIAANTTQVHIADKTILFSYETPVAYLDNTGYYRTAKKWSATTTRHINKWLDGAFCEEVEQELLDNLIKGA